VQKNIKVGQLLKTSVVKNWLGLEGGKGQNTKNKWLLKQHEVVEKNI